ncbi:hypothetical protein [Duganella radicis]|uniref:Uncharacterized protein n=1 Tax=Duganella radicis TaxID=551988 RepID=A0A6L6PD47_9BURK|nr:hypothetical protein [Duganella radicis]MTV36285.1 hypothetical protein [Duganella radicis]
MAANLSKLIPAPVEVGREALTVLGGLLIAAFILSRFPKIRDFVAGQSITVKDSSNNILF